MARLGDPKKYKLPIPMSGREDKQIFSYSGLKTAMMRLIKSLEPLDKQKTYDLAACFQDVAFQHLTRVIRFAIENSKLKIVNSSLLVGGGVAVNVEVRKRLRKLGKEFGIKVHFPTQRKLYGDNAGMIGLIANLNPKFIDPEEIDRKPNLKL
jgi:N6-L-threonylcarbamoyladenine synthase